MRLSQGLLIRIEKIFSYQKAILNITTNHRTCGQSYLVHYTMGQPRPKQSRMQKLVLFYYFIQNNKGEYLQSCQSQFFVLVINDTQVVRVENMPVQSSCCNAYAIRLNIYRQQVLCTLYAVRCTTGPTDVAHLNAKSVKTKDYRVAILMNFNFCVLDIKFGSVSYDLFKLN